MKRFLSILFLFSLLISLTACGGAPRDDVSPHAPPEAAPPEGPADIPEASDPAGDEARRAVFARILRTAHDQQLLPDGIELDSGGSVESIEGNLFALHDVDGDGAEELILLWQNACMAGQMELVYGYGETAHEVRQELRECPGVIFYDNGAVEAPWSHNQGWANEFWPYRLYRYHSGTDTYENMGAVDAWDKTVASDGFPLDVDADGDGMVYVLLTDNWNYTTHRDPGTGAEYWYYEEPPVDGEEYLRWRDGIVGDAEALELSFLPLTAENIAEALEVPYEPLVTTLLPDAVG